MFKKLPLLAAIGALAVAVPAVAQAGNHPPTSHKCTPHGVAYRASGTLVSSALTQNADKTWSGTIVVHVTRTNHHAMAAKHNDVTFTLTSAHVTFGHGITNPPPAGSRVNVKGSITTLAKKCDQTGFTPTVTVHHVVILAAKPPKS